MKKTLNKIFNFNIKKAFKENVIDTFKENWNDLRWVIQEIKKDILNFSQNFKRYQGKHYKTTRTEDFFNCVFSFCAFVFNLIKEKIKEAIKWLTQKLHSNS